MKTFYEYGVQKTCEIWGNGTHGQQKQIDDWFEAVYKWSKSSVDKELARVEYNEGSSNAKVGRARKSESAK